MRKFIRLIYACDVCENVVFGENLKLWHNGLAVVIGADVVMGDNVEIFQNVTIGYKNVEKVAPVIGNNVKIGSGSAVLGNVYVGNNVFIGANSVVVNDVPDNMIVAGNPAIIIGRNKK